MFFHDVSPQGYTHSVTAEWVLLRKIIETEYRVRNLKFTTYLKFATCENTNKINELW